MAELKEVIDQLVEVRKFYESFSIADRTMINVVLNLMNMNIVQ